MCERCREKRAEILADLTAVLNGDTENKLYEAVEAQVEGAMEHAKERIAVAVEAGAIEMPTDEEIREEIRTCALGQLLASAGAGLARTTQPWTDDGQEPLFMILGSWAAVIRDIELREALNTHLSSLLGMGDN